MLTSTIKNLLNRFADSQPALNDRTKPRATSGIALGDLVDDAVANLRVTKEAVYDFSVHGGSVGAKSLSLTLPKGAIPVSFMTHDVTTLASGGAATIALSVGSVSLLAATAFNDASLVGIDKTEISALSALSADGAVVLTIAGAALTAGKLRIVIEYIKA